MQRLTPTEREALACLLVESGAAFDELVAEMMQEAFGRSKGAARLGLHGLVRKGYATSNYGKSEPGLFRLKAEGWTEDGIPELVAALR